MCVEVAAVAADRARGRSVAATSTRAHQQKSTPTTLISPRRSSSTGRSTSRCTFGACAVCVGLCCCGADAGHAGGRGASRRSCRRCPPDSPTYVVVGVEADSGRGAARRPCRRARTAHGRVQLIDSDTGAQLPDSGARHSRCAPPTSRSARFHDDPDFARPAACTCTTRVRSEPGGCVNRVSAFTMAGDTIVRRTEQVLIDNISSLDGNHNAGDIEIGNDGYLYIATGDAGRDPRATRGGGAQRRGAGPAACSTARSCDSTGSPVRRRPATRSVAPDGRVREAGGTRRSTPATSCREIFAWGLRNPYRFAFDPNTSATRFFINDVGQSGSQREEVNEGLNGANYGWNTCEGALRATPGLTDPIESYPTHARAGTSPAGRSSRTARGPSSTTAATSSPTAAPARCGSATRPGAGRLRRPVPQRQVGIADMAFVLERAAGRCTTSAVQRQVGKITYGTPPSTPAGPLAYERLPSRDAAVRQPDHVAARPYPRGQHPPDRLGARGVGARRRSSTSRSPARRRRRSPRCGSRARPGPHIEPQRARRRGRRPTRRSCRSTTRAASWCTPGDDRRDRRSPGSSRPSRARRRPAVSSRPSRARRRQPATGRGGQRVHAVRTRSSTSRSGRGQVSRLSASTRCARRRRDRTAGAAPGWLTAHAGGTTPPPSSNLNVNGGADTRTNLVVVPLGADGSIDLFLSQMETSSSR